MARGIDVFRLKPSEFLSQNEIDAAMQFRLQEFNSQNQPKVAWPPTSAVAKALHRSAEPLEGHLAAARARRSPRRSSKVDRLRTGKEGNAKASLDALETLAGQVEADPRRPPASIRSA